MEPNSLVSTIMDNNNLVSSSSSPLSTNKDHHQGQTTPNNNIMYHNNRSSSIHNSNEEHHHHNNSTIPYSVPNIVNNTFHSNFDTSLLPFTFAPPPTRFFSMLHHTNNTNHQQDINQNSTQVVATLPSSNTNSNHSNCPCSSNDPSSKQSSCHQHNVPPAVGGNLFIPNGGDNVVSITATSTRASRSSSNASSNKSDDLNSDSSNSACKNQDMLDAPASVLLLEPPSLSTIIDDHHPTIPTSAYYLRKQEEQVNTNQPMSVVPSPKLKKDNSNRKAFPSEEFSNEISVENCEESVCNICGCEEDKIEAELRLQDKLERKASHKRTNSEAMYRDEYDSDHMSDDSPQELSETSNPKKRKMLSQLESLETLEGILRQLEPDCVLYIFQFLNCSGKDYWFSDIKNMYGRFRYNNQVLPLYKFITIEQHNPLLLDETNNRSVVDCNIQSLTIERKTNQPLECENGYLKKLGLSLKTFIYYNRCNNLTSKNPSENVISIGNPNSKSNTIYYADVMDYLSSEDEKDLSSFELIEDENSHIVGLKRRSRAEGSCFLKELYRNCKVLEKLKIVDITGYVPFKVSMRPGTNRPVDCLAFTNTLTKIRLFNCMLPNHTLQAISKMANLKSLHFEKTFVSDPNQYDLLLKLRNLEVLKIQVTELPTTVFKNLTNSFPKLTKLFINVLSNNNFEENLNVEQLRELKSLTLVSHFKVDLLSIMRHCLNLKHLHLGFDVCFNHIFPNERLTSCILRNVFISPDRSKVLVQNNTLRSLQLSPASIRAAQKELTFIKQQRQALNKPLLSITEY